MILCCGEALIDMLPRTTTLGEAAFAPYAGGALFNTAIALGRLGAPAAMFTGLSTDMLGEILARTLAESHVDFSLAARSGRPMSRRASPASRPSSTGRGWCATTASSRASSSAPSGRRRPHRCRR